MIRISNIAIHSDHRDEEAIKQLTELSKRQWVDGCSVQIMPDYHAGKGAVIGTTVVLNGKVDPMAVGVDIGCAVSAVRIAEADFDPEKLEEVIEHWIPAGLNIGTTAHDFDLSGLITPVNVKRELMALGSLGGGNHFIEVDRDSENRLWLIVHCGSRHLGVKVAVYHDASGSKAARLAYLNKRREIINSLKEAGREREIQDSLRHIAISDLPLYLEGQAYEDYIHDMKIAQAYSRENHRIIEDTIIEEMGWHPLERIMTMHNYISDDGILRKGAVSAKKGEVFLCPMNMRDGTLLCIGKGNPEWNFSAPHGAGRIMSRSQARAGISVDEFEKSMNGIWSCSVGESTLDESPFAYKDADEIMEYIQETAEIADVMKPVFNFKAH